MQKDSDLDVACSQIIEQLRFIRRRQFFGCFYFDDNLPFDKEINAISADIDSAIYDVKRNLSLDSQAPIGKFYAESIRAWFLKKTKAKLVVDAVEPAYHFMSDATAVVERHSLLSSICVHLR